MRAMPAVRRSGGPGVLRTERSVMTRHTNGVSGPVNGVADSKTGNGLPLACISGISALAPETGAFPMRFLTVCSSAGEAGSILAILPKER